VDTRPALTILSGAAGMFAFCRLIAARLLTIYPWFAALLVVGSLQGLLWLTGDPKSQEYALWWGITVPVLLACRVAAVFEAGRLLMSSSPWWKLLACRLAIGSVLVGLAVSLVNGLDGLQFSHIVKPRLVFYMLSIGLRYSYTILCTVCGMFWAWAALFRVDVSDSLYRHLGILTGYFACNATGYLVINTFPGTAPLVGAFTTGSSVAWYVLWGISFSGDRERLYNALAESFPEASGAG